MHIKKSRPRPDRSAYQPLLSEDWRESLGKLSPSDPTAKFNSLVRELGRRPSYMPTDTELSILISECMFRGKVKPLSNLLAQVPLQTLEISSPANEHAWRTLLEAMPASNSVSQLTVSKLILSKQEFDWASTSLLFELLGQLPDLKSLNFKSCTVRLSAPPDPPSCPPLLELRNLHFEDTNKPFNLALELLNACANLSGFHLDTNHGIDEGEHDSLAEALSDRHALTLQELTLRYLRDEKCVLSYSVLIKNAAALHHVDLSLNELSSSTLQNLKEVLSGKTGLTSLSLAGCCPASDEMFYEKQVARIVSLESLVSLDLSLNKFPSSMKPVLMAITSHPRLQSLNLCDVTMSGELVTDVLPIILEKNTTLISLKLLTLKDSDFARLVVAMNQNHSLRSLSIPNLERRLSTVSAEESHRLFPNYLALMGRVALNERAWEIAVMEGPMQVVLGSMSGIAPKRVFLDVARYAAGHVAAEGTGNEAMALSLVNKEAHEKSLAGLAALKRLHERK
ncbi:hypothetical protein H4CHR_03656 [Variovorax sp. PBS-H4]|uniref:hypothetical protein n=1 Tax=Variovorax sp. PBS-H4 TaxID=434008 RepID=UPI001317CFB7|nr:hypothetical protein [Variovorax sp. PBS-H4]VTU35441.1 hypothetical protein H4CHR_03656 [Variovorax sp. PBS-H4]